MGITYTECASGALVILNAMCMGHIVIYGLSDPAVFSTLSYQKYDFRKKLLLNITQVSWYFPRPVSDIFFILKKNKQDIKNVHWKCTLVFVKSAFNSCKILMKHGFSRKIFGKYSNIKFHKNPSSGSIVVQCGQKTETDGQIWRS
jgi:hypothetical protein